MNTGKNVVRISIVGEEYTLRSEASPEHTRAVAEHVDRAIRRILEGGGVVETHKAAILAALQIADELLRLRAGSARLTERIEGISKTVRRWLPPDQRGDGDRGDAGGSRPGDTEGREHEMRDGGQAE